MTGVCACGMGSVLAGRSFSADSDNHETQTDTNPNMLQQAWISALLDGMDNKLSEEDLRSILKPCALTHYEKLGMDNVLKDYIGKIDEFINYLVTEWNWKVEYNKEEGKVICDENKAQCVCPMVNKLKGIASSAICYCSEGFIEKMFSTVTGKEVKGKVLSSVIRGDKSCRYQVLL